MVVRHNTILVDTDQTDAVSFFQDFGTQANKTIDNNLLAGGGYTIYGGGGNKGATSNIKITNNRISSIYFAKGGYWGWPRTSRRATRATWRAETSGTTPVPRSRKRLEGGAGYGQPPQLGVEIIESSTFASHSAIRETRARAAAPIEARGAGSSTRRRDRAGEVDGELVR